MLPKEYLSFMQQFLLPAEFEEFIRTFAENRTYGLRLNPQKIASGQALPFSLEPIPWCTAGYYYQESEHPGRHPYHDAGLYYIQEPSAMAVAESLGVTGSSVVLDLCAAPGGKSTQIASFLGKHGLLVANEIHPARARILSENLERWGAVQAVVLNETPQKLARNFSEFFTHILVDAPCSGEGMFRKDPEAIEHWSLSNVNMCTERQKEILAAAVQMLRPDGVLVYSTCTFNPYENEQMIEWLLTTYPDFEVEILPIATWISGGRTEWTEHKFPSIEKCGRLWPQKLKGEGHFVARLRKLDTQADKPMRTNTPISRQNKKARKQEAKLSLAASQKKLWETFVETFAKEANLLEESASFHWIHPCVNEDACLVNYGEHLYLQHDPFLPLAGLKVVRPGVYLGQMKANRFEPGHGLAMAIHNQVIQRQQIKHVNLSSESSEIISYLKGESVTLASDKGWTLVTVDGHSIGFGKSDGRIIKNHYPKSLRRQW
ncbi:RsmB/NOP family class I SAM-dependent RNA methyltransferase [Fodinisporobacter ferrooxydans]|uniref:RsmB/NOP family class I SAM-dependent RNA methyltransferase n=1 Tax=Fodinisporobacter ferrooxydans TaxID=2901836 RepID=A0ABY4CJ45_9BACL|nr:RsmB/NOP family class I SAM-dependent RNA methyltransferase [Alicyclobacillaceae bacterium MYW30-H2]